MLKILLIAALIYLLYGSFLYLFQRNLLFPGQNIKQSDIVTEKIENLEKVWLNTSVGKVEAWFITTRINPGFRKNPTIIFAHGNFEIIDFCLYEAFEFNKLGLNVLLVEFPGFGRSEGNPSQKSITETYVQAYDWLVENEKAAKDKIIVFGRSLGGGAVCVLAKERKVGAIILQSTFSSVKRMARRYLAPGFLVKDPFDNLSVVKSFDGPILIFHGKFDEVIPYENGKKLYENSLNGQLVSYNCNHNNCPPNWDEYFETIRKFLIKNNLLTDQNDESKEGL